jgi:hypothetical protein
MTNFVKLTNDLLTRLNEVTLDPQGDGFDTVRGVQALAKNAINNSIREILQVGQEWPFLKTTNVQTLTPGQTTYDFPTSYSSADYESFYLKKVDALGNMPAYLDAISYEDYVQNYRALDDTGPADGRGAPVKVFQTYDEAFGVTPSPDKAYEVEYTYWSFPDDLELYNDKCVIPGRFNYVIVDGAMMYMMRFRSNDQSANIHQQKFQEGIRQMRRVLIDEPLEVRSTVINRVAVNGR